MYNTMIVGHYFSFLKTFYGSSLKTQLQFSRFKSNYFTISQCRHLSSTLKNGQTSHLYSEAEVETRSHKKFIWKTERGYWRMILEKYPKYKSNIVTPSDIQDQLHSNINKIDIERISSTPENLTTDKDVVEAFRCLVSYDVFSEDDVSENQFSTVFSILKERMISMSDEDLLQVSILLASLPLTKDPAHHYNKLTNVLEDVSRDRSLKSWFPNNQLSLVLKIADVLYWRNRSAYTRYISKKVFKNTSNPEWIIQMTFYFLRKKLSENIKMFHFEKLLFRAQDQLSLDELAVGVSAVRASKSKLQNTMLVLLLLKRLKDEHPNIHEKAFGVLCKTLSTSVPIKLKKEVVDVLNIWLPLVPHMPTLNVANLIMLAAQCGVSLPSLNTAALEKITRDLSALKENDWENVLGSFMMCNLNCDSLRSLAASIMNRVEKNDTLGAYQELSPLASLFHKLLICDIFPEHQLHKLFSEKEAHASKMVSQFKIDVHLEVFYPNYKGARLSSETRRNVFQREFEKSSKGIQAFMQDVEKIFLSLYENRDELYLITQLVPCYASLDFVICKNEDGNMCPVPEEIRHYNAWECKRAPVRVGDSGKKLLAITCVRKQVYNLYKKHSAAIIRHQRFLQKLGYEPVLIPILYWEEMSADDKTSVLTKIMMSKNLSNFTVLDGDQD